MSVKRVAIGVMLVGAVLASVMIWNWSRAPIPIVVPNAGPIHAPTASLSLLSPGILSIGLGSTKARTAGLALQEDGTIVTLENSSDPSPPFLVRLTGSGQLADPGVAPMVGATRYVRGLSIARDGKIAVAGGGSAPAAPGAAPATHFLVALFLPNGMPDSTFGQEGTTLTNVQWRWWGPSDAAQAVAVQDDGKIVATGSTIFATGPLSQGSYCATVRFNRDGSIDRNFGDNGRVQTLVGAAESCGGRSVFITLDGKIIVAGTIRSGNGQHASAVIRYLPDGTPDSQFGQDGIADALGPNISDTTAVSAAVDSQGRVIVVGSQPLSYSSSRFWLARYDTNGKLDRSFGENGIVAFHDFAGAQVLFGVALQPDGKIVAAGGDFPEQCESCPLVANKVDRIAVVRLNVNGSVDEFFADDGFLFISSPRYRWGARGIAIQPDGKLLIVGDVFEQGTGRPPPPSPIILMRLNQDGTPDRGFGTGGDMH